MEDNKNGGYSAEGRRLRPRRPRISGDRNNSGNGEGRSYNREGQGDRGSYSSDRGGYSSDRGGYGERRNSYGGSRGGYGGNRGGNYRSGGYNSGRGYDRNNYSQDGNSSEEGAPRQEGGYRRNSYGGSRGSYDGNRRGYSGERRSNYGGGRGGYRGNDRRGGFGDDHRGGFGGNRGKYGNNRGGYGQSKRGPKPSKYSFSPDSGINDMIASRPQVDQMDFKGNNAENAVPQFQEEVRLNKYIANSGVCSRREADQMIQAGVVTVNGEVVTELGTKVNVLKDEVKFNGELLKGEKKVYIVMNKPKGYVTTSSDPHADKTVMDLLKKCEYRVFPVGRLDKNTTGVLMFTNDGEMAERLTHPSYDKKKIYQVILDHDVTEEDKEKILSGIVLNDGEVNADDLQYIEPEDHRKMGIEIHSGKNRIVRRIFESLGYEVKALDRVYFAGLTKKGLKKGEWRFLTPGEANILRAGSYM